MRGAALAGAIGLGALGGGCGSAPGQQSCPVNRDVVQTARDAGRASDDMFGIADESYYVNRVKQKASVLRDALNAGDREAVTAAAVDMLDTLDELDRAGIDNETTREMRQVAKRFIRESEEDQQRGWSRWLWGKMRNAAPEKRKHVMDMIKKHGGMITGPIVRQAVGMFLGGK